MSGGGGGSGLSPYRFAETHVNFCFLLEYNNFKLLNQVAKPLVYIRN